MAVTIIAQKVAQIVGITLPADVENDTNAAADGTVNVRFSFGNNDGFVVFEGVAAATIAAIAKGDCTLIVSQGTGSLSATATA